MADGAAQAMSEHLTALAEAARSVPEILGVTVYRLDSDRRTAQIAASSLHARLAGALPRLPDGATPPTGPIALANHPALQRVLRGRVNLTLTPDEFLAGQLSEPLLSAMLAALRGSAVAVYPLDHGLIAFYLSPAGITATNPATLHILAMAFDLLLRASADLNHVQCRVQNLERVQKMASSVVSQLDLDQVLAQIAAATRDVVRCDWVTLWLYHEAEGMMERRAVAGIPFPDTAPPLGERVPLHEMVHGLAIQMRSDVLLHDVATDPRITPAWRERTLQNGMAAISIIPLLFEGRPLGTLGIAFRTPMSLRPDQLDVAHVMASYAAIALHNAQLYDQMHQHMRELEGLHRIAGAVVSRLDLDAALAQITAAARDLLNADRVVAWVYRHAEAILERAAWAARPYSEHIPSPAERMALHETIQGLAVETHASVWIADIATDSRLTQAGRDRLLRNGMVSIYVAPLLFEGQVLGTLGVGYATPTSYQPDQEELAQTLANYAAIALHNAQQYDQTVQRAGELEALHRISAAVVSRLEMPAILQEIAAAGQKVLAADRVTVWRYHPEADAIEIQAISGLRAPDEQGIGLRVPLSKERAWQAIQARQPHIIKERAHIPIPTPEAYYQQMAKGVGLRRVILAPVRRDDTLLGVIGFGYTTEREFSPAMLDLAQTLANHAAAAIANAELNNQTAQRTRELEALHRISTAVVSRADIPTILQEIAEATQTALQADRVTLWLYDVADDTIHLQAVSGLEATLGQVSGPRIHAPTSAVRQALQERKALIMTADQLPPEGTDHLLQQVWDLGIRSLLITPILHEDRVMGFMGLSYMTDREFSQATLDLAQTIANHAAAAIANARLYHQTASRAQELALRNAISNRLSANLDIPTVLKSIAEAASELFHADGVVIWALQDGTYLEALARTGRAAQFSVPPISLTEQERLLVTAFHTRKIIFIPDVHDAQYPIKSRQQLADAGLQAWIAVPLLQGDHAVGVISLTYASTPQYTEDTRRLLEELAGHATAAFVNAQQYQQATHRAQEMALLHAISNRLSANLDLATVLQSIAEVAFQLSHADGVGIWGLRDGTHLESLARSGRAALVDVPTIPVDDVNRLLVATFLSKELSFTPDIASSTIPEPFRSDLMAAGLNASLIVPMLHEGQAVGVIAMMFEHPPQLTNDMQSLVQELANRAAAAIANAQKFQEMSLLATRDGLTGLLNHREFHLRLQDELAVAQRIKTSVSVVMVDLDNFKQINDRFGHQQGDLALQETAGVLQREVRASDFVARYGGEEFAIILPGAPGDLAAGVAERIRRAIEDHPITVGTEETITLTTSIGIATFPEDGGKPDELIAAADRALYAAKGAGKNRVVTASNDSDGPR